MAIASYHANRAGRRAAGWAGVVQAVSPAEPSACGADVSKAKACARVLHSIRPYQKAQTSLVFVKPPSVQVAQDVCSLLMMRYTRRGWKEEEEFGWRADNDHQESSRVTAPPFPTAPVVLYTPTLFLRKDHAPSQSGPPSLPPTTRADPCQRARMVP